MEDILGGTDYMTWQYKHTRICSFFFTISFV